MFENILIQKFVNDFFRFYHKKSAPKNLCGKIFYCIEDMGIEDYLLLMLKYIL